MLTIIAALYVVLPALLALACVALAHVPMRIEEPAHEAPALPDAVVRAVTLECLRKSFDALVVAQTQHTAGARRVWLDVSLRYQRRAERYVAIGGM